jgi:hypothetical protein
MFLVTAENTTLSRARALPAINISGTTISLGFFHIQTGSWMKRQGIWALVAEWAVHAGDHWETVTFCLGGVAD